MKASVLYGRLAHTFQPETCTEVFPVIGLQADCAQDIEKVYTAAFASTEVLEQLRDRKAHDCMLFTHHPKQQREHLGDVPPELPQYWLDYLKENRISLFSYHIPLDRNGFFSPGNSLARAMGAQPFDTFYEQNMVRMGVICIGGQNTARELADTLAGTVGHPVRLYSYGPDRLEGGRFAIMAGGAKNTEIYAQLADYGVNTFITGVTNPAAEWTKKIHEAARANQINLIGGTHYSTEKFAVISMIRYFEALGLEAEFLPETPRMEEL